LKEIKRNIKSERKNEQMKEIKISRMDGRKRWIGQKKREDENEETTKRKKVEVEK
jgi:hypothetical protein